MKHRGYKETDVVAEHTWTQRVQDFILGHEKMVHRAAPASSLYQEDLRMGLRSRQRVRAYKSKGGKRWGGTSGPGQERLALDWLLLPHNRAIHLPGWRPHTHPKTFCGRRFPHRRLPIIPIDNHQQPSRQNGQGSNRPLGPDCRHQQGPRTLKSPVSPRGGSLRCPPALARQPWMMDFEADYRSVPKL